MKNITKIFIDIIIFTGDIEVNKPFTNNNDFVVDQYESINKIFISIKINQNPQLPDKFKSISNSFYKILYNFAVEGIDDSLITNKIQTGFSYLATIDPSIRESYNIGNKIITINNPNVENLKPIAISFFFFKLSN